jgi:hypothetical protein
MDKNPFSQTDFIFHLFNFPNILEDNLHQSYTLLMLEEEREKAKSKFIAHQ